MHFYNFSDYNLKTSLEKVSEPQKEPVTLDEAKSFFREDRSIEDQMISSLVSASRANIEDQTGWHFINTDFKIHLRNFCDVRIPKKPLSGSVTVKYDDENGNEQTLSSSEYTTYSQEDPVRVEFHGDLPDLYSDESQDYPVRLEFTIGFGPNNTDVPDKWKTAIKLLAMIYWKRDIPKSERENINPFNISVLGSLIDGDRIGRFH